MNIKVAIQFSPEDKQNNTRCLVNDKVNKLCSRSPEGQTKLNPRDQIIFIKIRDH